MPVRVAERPASDLQTPLPHALIGRSETRGYEQNHGVSVVLVSQLPTESLAEFLVGNCETSTRETRKILASQPTGLMIMTLA